MQDPHTENPSVRTPHRWPSTIHQLHDQRQHDFQVMATTAHRGWDPSNGHPIRGRAPIGFHVHLIPRRTPAVRQDWPVLSCPSRTKCRAPSASNVPRPAGHPTGTPFPARPQREGTQVIGERLNRGFVADLPCGQTIPRSEHLDVRYIVFKVSLTHCGEPKSFIKSNEVLLCRNSDSEFRPCAVTRTNGAHHQLFAQTRAPRCQVNGHTAYARLFILNARGYEPNDGASRSSRNRFLFAGE